MIGIIALIDQIAIGIYFLLAAAALLALRRYLIHRQAYRSSYFDLERDLARYRRSRAITWLLLFIELAILLLGLQVVVVPTLLEDQQIESLVAASRANEGSFATPVPGPPAADIGIDPVALPRSADQAGAILATPLPTATAVGTLIPADPPQGCDLPEAQLRIPGNGMRVFQPIPIVGTAFADQFSYASLEISGPSTRGNFQVIADQPREVREFEAFSQFVPAGYEEGIYNLRLMVYDITNSLAAFCQVQIYISAPLPTLTPSS